MRAIALVLVVVMLVGLVGCHRGPRGPLVTGAALYAHAAEIDRDGSATVIATDARELAVRRHQWLVTKEREQVFVVDQVVRNCKGGDPTTEADCTIALLLDKQFTLHDEEPKRAVPKKGDWKYADQVKAMIWSGAIGGVFTFGAYSCDAFEDCKQIMAYGVGLSALVFVIAFVSIFFKIKD